MSPPRPEGEQLRRPVATGFSRAALAELYDRDRLRFLLDVVKEHGPVVELAPGTIVVNEPQAVQDIYRRTNDGFLMAENLMREEIGAHRGDTEFDEWMAGRRAVLSGTRPSGALEDHASWLVGQIGLLGDRWTSQGLVADPIADLEDLTSRSWARFCFGSRDARRVAERTGDLLAALSPIVSSPFELPPVLRRVLPRFRRARRAKRKLEEEILRLLAGRGQGGLADLLAEEGLPRAAVVHMLTSTGIAAYGVPASALAWTVTELARHPAVAAQAAESLPGDVTTTVAPNVEWVVRESLRLWPPTWLTLRTTEAEQVCGRWLIPANAAVVVAPFVVHRTARCFERAEEFMPNRWRTCEPPKGAYIPFGGGTRSCIGTRFALTELHLAVALLARRFRFSLAGGAPRPDARRTLTPAGLRIRVEPR